MGQQAEDDADLELEDDLDSEETADEQISVDTPESTEGDEGQGTGDGGEAAEVIISIGEDSPPQDPTGPAPEWVKDLRKTNRQLQKEVRELRAKAQTGGETPTELGPEPKIADFDFDEDAFKKSWTTWNDKKRQHDQVVERRNQDQLERQKAWDDKVKSYDDSKKALGLRDFDDAEAVAGEILSELQQSLILDGADKPAELIYALGKFPKKAQELAKITNPVKFAFAVAKLEKDLKIERRSGSEGTPAAPTPERRVGASSKPASAVDSTLKRLEDEARRTNDYTKVLEYKRKLKSKTA